MNHVGLGVRDMPKHLDEDLVAARLLDDFDNLTRSRETGYLSCSVRLVPATKTLSTNVLGILVNVPKIPLSG